MKEGEGDKVTLRWSLTNCQRAEISYGGIPTTVDPVQGSLEISVSTSSTVTIRAYDKAGKFVEKQLTLTVEGKGDLLTNPKILPLQAAPLLPQRLQKTPNLPLHLIKEL